MPGVVRLFLRALGNLAAAASWPARALVHLLLGRRPPAWVVVRLDGPLDDFAGRLPRGLLRLGRGPRGRVLSDLREVFERVARARSCRGLVLRAGAVEASQARLDALSALVASLRAAGKQVVVYADNLPARLYAALCGATRLHLPPGGSLDLTGVAIELTAAGAALAAAGIRPEFIRREAHKTAPELFTAFAPTAIQRETAAALLDEAAAALTQRLAGRGLTAAEASARIDGGPYLGRQAAAAGLIDSAIYYDELVAELVRDSGHSRLPFFHARLRDPAGRGGPGTSPGRGAAASRRGLSRGEPSLPSERALERGRVAPLGLRPLRPPPEVAIVPLRGLIREGKSARLPSGRFCGSESIAAALARARGDRRIRAVVLYVDSRGGSAAASDLIWHEVTRTGRQKPVVAYVDSVAASGGYFAACGASRIVAAPLSIVGSIGVFWGRFEISGALAKLGIRREVMTRGASGGLAHPLRPMTAPEAAAANRLVEAIYADFLGAVAAGRAKSVAEIRPLAGGRIYTGARALAAGLVDATGGFTDAVRAAASAAGLPEAPPRLRVFADKPAGGLLSGFAALGDALGPRVFAYYPGPAWGG